MIEKDPFKQEKPPQKDNSVKIISAILITFVLVSAICAYLAFAMLQVMLAQVEEINRMSPMERTVATVMAPSGGNYDYPTQQATRPDELEGRMLRTAALEWPVGYTADFENTANQDDWSVQSALPLTFSITDGALRLHNAQSGPDKILYPTIAYPSHTKNLTDFYATLTSPMIDNPDQQVGIGMYDSQTDSYFMFILTPQKLFRVVHYQQGQTDVLVQGTFVFHNITVANSFSILRSDGLVYIYINAKPVARLELGFDQAVMVGPGGVTPPEFEIIFNNFELRAPGN